MVSNDHQRPLWTEERETSGSCDFPEAWIGRVQCGWSGKAGRVPPSHCIAFRPLTGCQSVNSVYRWQTLDSLDCPIPAIFPQIHIITGFVLSRLKPLHGERPWKNPCLNPFFPSVHWQIPSLGFSPHFSLSSVPFIRTEIPRHSQYCVNLEK